mmetsp:Transcript_137473/g.342940  ORF Transcript_137473/g.342940 Transcript_137473/m.342940 type:complete len:410 (+) Transcript_137473:48-1277(+)|eukprot:CAMPEP_0115509374 /NCGR_PEP_ID=MMETSP0271-20121206/72818_1 /TAXON_ID=71861 /ORGANISM="Scrippsiella trochoidea, Strain CCMP3099" /LENGTH=409 /DNA_ID=CAMNT_0002939213 /DNA_START=23 /DNA_END=1252 /DNA_ORIENTATION=+
MAGCNGSLHGILKSIAFVGSLAMVYMAISTGLITFNKYLMHEDRFPYAIAIGVLHMSSSFGFNSLLLRLCPSLYPSLTDEEQKVEIDRSLILRVLIPIATCFAAQLILSNMAFMHSSVTMLQMMKQSNVVLVYIFSLALSLETFAFQRAAALGLIFAATALTIHGEMHFSAVGFSLQGVSMFCESMKLTLQSHSLSATGRRLDAFTYVLLVAPMVLLVLLTMLIAFAIFWPGRPQALCFPPLAAVWEYRWLLLSNGCLAFAMQIAHAAFMKNSSAITFILTGVVMKDVVIVAVCAIFLEEELSPVQVIGFSLQLLGVLAWSFMKAAPNIVSNNNALPALPRGATGIPVAMHPERAALREQLKDMDSELGGMCHIPRVSTTCSESTMAPQDDSFDLEESYKIDECLNEGI